MIHIFIYRLKSLIKNKELVFWALLFPLVLVSLFNMAFGNLVEANLIRTVNVGIIGDKESHVVEIMEEIKHNNENLFNISYVSYEEGRELLTENELHGLIKIDDLILIIDRSNISQTILYQFLNNYKQTTSLIESQIELNPGLLTSDWLETINEFENYVKRLHVSETSNDIALVMFYSAIAMTCLFGAFLSVAGMKNIYATLSKVGARVTLSPYPKIKLILADFIACTLLILISQTILILYLNYIIGISFTNQLGSIVLIVFLGSILSTSFGYLLAFFTKSDGFVSAITMTWCFMAGMMSPQLKAIIENVVPFINYINPVALITDSFLKLLYFDDFLMIVPYLIALLVWTIVCLVVTSVMLRRERYDSI